MLVWVQSPFTSSLSLREFACLTVPPAQDPPAGENHPTACENYPTFASKLLPGSGDPALTGRENSTSQNRAGPTGNWEAQLCTELLSWAAAAWDGRIGNPSGMRSGTQLGPVCVAFTTRVTPDPCSCNKILEECSA